MNSKLTKERKEYISYVSTRVAAKFREDFSILQRGKRLSEDHRKKLSEAKLGRERKAFTEDTKNNISKGKKGKPFGTKIIDPNGKLYNTLTECSKAYDNIPISTLKFWAEHIPERGFKLYDEDTKKFVKDDSCLNLKVRSLETYKIKKVIDSNGVIYKSIKDCANKTKHTKKTISDWIHNHPEKGFKFYTEEDN